MIIEDQNALQAYLVKTLASLSEANPDALSKYVLALVKKDKPENELKKICVEQLDVFLQNETEPFVQKLFEVIKNKGYKYIYKEKKEIISQKSNPDAEIEKRRHSSSENSSEEYSDENHNENAYKISSHQQDLNSIKHVKPLQEKEPSLDSYVSDSDQIPQIQSQASKISSAFKGTKRVHDVGADEGTSEEEEEEDEGDSAPRRGGAATRNREREPQPTLPSRLIAPVKGSNRRSGSDRDPHGRNKRDYGRHHHHRHKRPAAPWSGGASGVKDRLGASWAPPSQTRIPGLENGSGPEDEVPRRTIPSAIVRKRCSDYDEKGFCMQGDMCPYDHGNDPVIVRDLNMFRGQPPSHHTASLAHSSSKSPLKDATSPKTMQHSLSSSVTGSVVGDQYNPENPSIVALAPPPIYPHIPPPSMLPPPPYGAPPFFPPLPYGPGVVFAPGSSFQQPQPPIRTRELVPLIGGSERYRSQAYGNSGRPIMHPGFSSNPKTHLYDNNHPPSIGQDFEALVGAEEAELNDYDRAFENDLDDEYESGGAKARSRLSFNNGTVATAHSMANSIKNKYHGTRSYGAGLGLKKGIKSGKINENRTLELRKIPVEMNTISQINGYFQKFGQLVNIQVNHANDPQSALITFSSNQEAYRAYKCQEPVFNNRFVKIFWHRTANQDAIDKEDSTNINDILLDSEIKEEYTPLKPEIKSTAHDSSLEDPDRVGVYPSYVPQGNKARKSVFTNNVFNDPSKFKINHKLESADNYTAPDGSNALNTSSSNKEDGTALDVVSKEKQRKDALELQQSLEKQRYELLLKQIQNQKMLITKMEENPSLFSTKEKGLMIKNLNSLMTSISKLKSEIDLKRKLVKTASADGGKSFVNLEVIKTKKELLDVELELMTLQANQNPSTAPSQAGGNSDLEMRVAVLKAKALSMGLLLPHSDPHFDASGPGAEFRRKRRPRYATPLSYCSSYLDRRPKNILIKGVSEIESRSQLGAQITQMYGIKVVEINLADDPTPVLELQFGTRKEAEKVMAVGIVLDNEPVKMHWGPPSQMLNPEPPFKRKILDKSDLTDNVYSVDYTLSLPPHIVSELGENGTRRGVAVGMPNPEIEEGDEDEVDAESEARSWRP